MSEEKLAGGESSASGSSAGRRKKYVYNRNCKPPLPVAVREVLKQTDEPLSVSEITERVMKYEIATYDTKQAVRTIMQRLVKSGEVVTA